MRKLAQMLAFAGVKPGDRVADFMPGNGYFTRILSKVVGPGGRVYAFIPQEQIRTCEAAEIAGLRLIAHDPVYRNIEELAGPVNGFRVLQKLDFIWTAQNCHDLHDRFMSPADVRIVNKAFFDSLKPGAHLVIIDHAATTGAGLRDTERKFRRPLLAR